MAPTATTTDSGVLAVAEEYGPKEVTPGVPGYLPLPDDADQQIALPWALPGLHGTRASWYFPKGAKSLAIDFHLVYKIVDPQTGRPPWHEILACLLVQPSNGAAFYPVARHYSPNPESRNAFLPAGLVSVPAGSYVGLWINGWSLGRGLPFSRNALEAQCRLYVPVGTAVEFDRPPAAKAPAVPEALAWWTRRTIPAEALKLAKKERKRRETVTV